MSIVTFRQSTSPLHLKEMVKQIFSFLSLQEVALVKVANKALRELHIDTLCLNFRYVLNWSEQTRFLDTLKRAEALNCFYSTVQLENVTPPFDSSYPEAAIHDKSIWITALTKHPIKQLKLDDFFINLGKTGFDELVKIRTLTSLIFDIGAKEATRATTYLTEWPKLCSLEIGSLHEESGIQNVAEIFNLSTLTFYGSMAPSEALKHLKNSRVKELTFKFCCIDPTCLNSLKEMTKLEVLNIWNCRPMEEYSSSTEKPEIDEIALRVIAKTLPNLISYNGYTLRPYKEGAETELALDADEVPAAISSAEQSSQPKEPSDVQPPPLTSLPVQQPSQPAAISSAGQSSQPKEPEKPLIQPKQDPKDGLSTERLSPSNSTPSSERPSPSKQGLNSASEHRILPRLRGSAPVESPSRETRAAPVAVADAQAQSAFSRLCSGITACFNRLWVYLCALFCRRES